MDFDVILEKLEMDSNEYELAVRSSVNAYNPKILMFIESNMDIQFILDEYSVASYVLNYVCVEN